MKLALAASALFGAVVLAAPTEQVCDNGLNCYAAVHEWGGFIQYEPYQGNLMDACRNDENAIPAVTWNSQNDGSTFLCLIAEVLQDLTIAAKIARLPINELLEYSAH